MRVTPDGLAQVDPGGVGQAQAQAGTGAAHRPGVGSHQARAAMSLPHVGAQPGYTVLITLA
jgi:hypothetical protein